MELEMLKTIIEKTLGRNMDAITEKLPLWMIWEWILWIFSDSY